MPEKSQQAKPKRRAPVDATWCLQNLNNLTPQKFFEEFGYDNQSKGNLRYKRIIQKWIPDEKRNALLKTLKSWTKSEKAVSFWRDRCICESATVVEIESEHEDKELPKNRWTVSGMDASKMLFEYRRSVADTIKTRGMILEKSATDLAACFYMFLLIDDQHDSAQKEYFGSILLDAIKRCNHFDYDFVMMDVVYLKLSKIVYDLQRGVLAVEMAMIKLLELSIKERLTIYEKNLLKGIACMLNFLPTKEVDVKKLGESELWSTYHNPLLSSILSNAQENILLRWTNRAAECYISKRPDAIISALHNNQEVCLGYGECKLGGVSKKVLNMDIVKLAIFTQRTININNKKRVFSFNIEGFKVNFFCNKLRKRKRVRDEEDGRYCASSLLK